MNKKILVSLSIVGVVAAAVIGMTVAYFNDTETSQDNIFVAGTLDLRVDHLKQTYNDADCKTCNVVLISDPTNMVIQKNDVAITPYPAIFVGSNSPHFIHSAWTAEEDPTLAAAGAKWIWATDPTTAEDALNGAIYRFKKTFEWYGPVTGSDLWFAVGSDNGVEVWLNGVKVGENLGQYGYLKGSMLHIDGAVITANVVQGENILEFRVNNWPWPNGTYSSNPGGLIYKFEIDGLCGDNWFKTHCKLWGEKDLEPGDYFWDFDDIKPGDHGRNIISLHAYDNDAFACLLVNGYQDNENDLISPEANAGDTTYGPIGNGELSQFIKVFVWEDQNHDGIYQNGESVYLPPNNMIANLGLLQILLSPANTMDIGIDWCVGTQTVVGDNISCSGSGSQDVAQTDTFVSPLTIYAEQQRNNPNFKCWELDLPVCVPIGEEVCGNGVDEDCDGGDLECPPKTCSVLADCNDNNACTIEAACEGGVCVYQEQPCSDGNTCTIDSCDPISGCVHTFYTCDDGDPGTADYCDGDGTCTYI